MEVPMAYSQSRQLTLFPQQQVSWDAFSDDLQDAIEEVVSLLLECEMEPKEDQQQEQLQQTEATHV